MFSALQSTHFCRSKNPLRLTGGKKMIYKKIKFWKRLFLDQSVYPKKLKNKSIGKKENGCTSRGKTITAHLGFKAERHGRSSPSRHMKDCLEKKNMGLSRENKALWSDAFMLQF